MNVGRDLTELVVQPLLLQVQECRKKGTCPEFAISESSFPQLPPVKTRNKEKWGAEGTGIRAVEVRRIRTGISELKKMKGWSGEDLISCYREGKCEKVMRTGSTRGQFQDPNTQRWN